MLDTDREKKIIRYFSSIFLIRSGFLLLLNLVSLGYNHFVKGFLRNSLCFSFVFIILLTFKTHIFFIWLLYILARKKSLAQNWLPTMFNNTENTKLVGNWKYYHLMSIFPFYHCPLYIFFVYQLHIFFTRTSPLKQASLWS